MAAKTTKEKVPVETPVTPPEAHEEPLTEVKEEALTEMKEEALTEM